MWQAWGWYAYIDRHRAGPGPCWPGRSVWS